MIDRKKFIFSLVFTLFVIYLIFCFPTYSQLKFLSWYGPKDDIWLYIKEIIIHNDLKIIFALLFNALTIANVCGIFIS